MSWKESTGRNDAGPYVARAFLLSRAELRFFQSLLRSVERGVYVVAKVRLADVVSCTDVAPLSGTLGRITQKHLDFVLVDERYTRILAAIELDDSSHEQEKTIERDRFVNELLNSVGVPLLRVQAAVKYNPMVLRQQLAIALRPIRRENVRRPRTVARQPTLHRNGYAAGVRKNRGNS